MYSYRKLILLFTAIVFLTACKQKKKASLSGDEPVEVDDFIAIFQATNLPYQFDQALLQKKDNDSLRISYKVFTQFVPDSVLRPVFGKEQTLKIYPLGKAVASKEETYLLAKVSAAKRNLQAGYILVFGKEHKFIKAFTAWRNDQDMGKLKEIVTILDKKYTITRTQYRRNADGSTSEGKDIYAFNAGAADFMLIMTDALDDKMTELINPIDTLSRKHKLAADYSNGKMNLVSIRDGRKADRLSFFVHFEKNNGECIGELKGEALIKSPTMAEYREAGDPCVLQFRFSASAVILKEIEGCGSRRGLRCSFDGSYPKKKETKPKTTRSKQPEKK